MLVDGLVQVALMDIHNRIAVVGDVTTTEDATTTGDEMITGGETNMEHATSTLVGEEAREAEATASRWGDCHTMLRLGT